MNRINSFLVLRLVASCLFCSKSFFVRAGFGVREITMGPGVTVMAMLRNLQFPEASIAEKSIRLITFSHNLTNYFHCRLVIATASFGDRDVIWPLPPETSSDVCSFAFVDDVNLQLNANYYKVQPEALASHLRWTAVSTIHYPSSGSPRFFSRILKLLLPRFFPHADWSIWADSKIRFRLPPSEVFRRLVLEDRQRQADLYFFHHNMRVNVFAEQEIVVRFTKAPLSVIAKQRAYYNSRGLFKNETTGLIEGALIIRNHRSLAAQLASVKWFNEYARFPPRDQTSFNFVAYMLGFRPQINTTELKLAAERGKKELAKVSFSYWSEAMQSSIRILPRVILRDYFDVKGHIADFKGMLADNVTAALEEEASMGLSIKKATSVEERKKLYSIFRFSRSHHSVAGSGVKAGAEEFQMLQVEQRPDPD